MAKANEQLPLSKRPYRSRRVQPMHQQLCESSLFGRERGESSSSNISALEACADAFPTNREYQPRLSRTMRGGRKRCNELSIN